MTTYEDILSYPIYEYAETEIRDAIAAHLTFVCDFELDWTSFDFNEWRFYVRRSDGMIMYAHDSGCSCPIPFDGVKVAELKETDLAGVKRTVRLAVYEYTYRSSNVTVARLDQLVEDLKSAGAR